MKIFEIELAVNQIEANVDKLRAAVLVFPQSVVEGFQDTFPEVKFWQYSDFHDYVLNKLPQHYSCHRHHKFPMSPVAEGRLTPDLTPSERSAWESITIVREDTEKTPR